MPKGRRTRLWNALAVVTVLGAVASLADRASFGGLIIIGPSQCVTNADCSCTQPDCSAPGQGGFCVPINATLGVCQCNPGFGGANCSLTLGACCGASPPILNMTNPFPANGGVACRDLTELQCSFANGTSVTFAGNGTTCGSGICDPTHTPTETATATATATATRDGDSDATTATPTQTATPVPQGGACTQASQCDPSLFCSRQVCCDTLCNLPGESCALPGQVGTCGAIPPAPAPAASQGGLLVMLGALIAVGCATLALRRRRED